jgi:hypothetical protein
MSNQSLIRKPLENSEMVTSLDDAIRIGDIVAKSKMFPEVTDQAKAVVAILAGRELGIAPMASLRGIHVIKGKVEVGAGLLAAMIKASGKYNYKVATLPENEEKECLLLWSENIGGTWTLVGHSKFTIEDARRAKLIKPDSNWEKFPRAMLFARALTEGQRKHCPDIAIGAVYAEGEIPRDDDAIDLPPVTHVSPDQIPTAGEVFDSPRPVSSTVPLPAAWQDDSIACQIADQQIAETITKELQGPAVSQLKQKRKPAPDPDPVPALKPTLTAAQQRVSDAVMSLWKEHKKDKADVLTVVGNCIGREVKRSGDLSDDEAERVFKYLQAWGAELSADAAEPAKYDRKNRAHGPEIATEMDGLIKKLIALGMSAADISHLISELIAGPAFGRVIEHRFELDDEEALAAVEELRKKIGEMEAAKAEIIAADV